MTSDEIRELFLGFFEKRDHLRLPSGSLVPASFDPSVLLTTAGMQPLKPYFLGLEDPPHNRITTCQKSFRTVDMENGDDLDESDIDMDLAGRAIAIQIGHDEGCPMTEES